MTSYLLHATRSYAFLDCAFYRHALYKHDTASIQQRGDRDRGQTKGLNRDERTGAGAQLETGDGDEFRGGKRLRGRRRGSCGGKKPKGAGSLARPEESAGVEASGGREQGQKAEEKKQLQF